MKYGLFFLWVLLVPFLSFSQDDFLQGRLIDARSKESVSFATVRVKGRAVGVVSNLDGSFRIPEKFKNYGDTLEISSMGYKKRKILISNLPSEGVRKIYLQSSVFELRETVVEAKRKRRLSARAIVRRAIKNIPNNYPISPFSSVGYYRDYQLREESYINLNEAILEVFDLGFAKLDDETSKVRIYEYKTNPNFERDTLADNPYNYKSRQKIMDNAYLFDYYGNEFTILRVHDAIRNYNLGSFSFIDQLDKDLLRNHYFSRDGNTYAEEIPLYRIGFEKKQAGHHAFGTLYISHGDFAIHKLEYSVYSLQKGKPQNADNKHNISGKLLFEVLTEYQKNSGKLYPHYISFHNKFQLLNPDEFRVTNIYWSSEKKRFEFHFNREPQSKDVKQYDNYSIIYKGYKIKFGTLVNYENQVWLYPKITTEKDQEAIDQIEEMAKNNEFRIGVLSIKVENIRDQEGNLINEKQYQEVDQYREFFVQRIKPKVSIPTDSLFMNKQKPIFKEQPMYRPRNFDDYWMNTPLKSFE